MEESLRIFLIFFHIIRISLIFTLTKLSLKREVEKLFNFQNLCLLENKEDLIWQNIEDQYQIQ
jgi:hypothetical protein